MIFIHQSIHLDHPDKSKTKKSHRNESSDHEIRTPPPPSPKKPRLESQIRVQTPPPPPPPAPPADDHVNIFFHSIILYSSILSESRTTSSPNQIKSIRKNRKFFSSLFPHSSIVLFRLSWMNLPEIVWLLLLHVYRSDRRVHSKMNLLLLLLLRRIMIPIVVKMKMKSIYVNVFYEKKPLNQCDFDNFPTILMI